MSFVVSPYSFQSSSGGLAYKSATLYTSSGNINLPGDKAVGDLAVIQSTIDFTLGGSTFTYPSGITFLTQFDWGEVIDEEGTQRYRTRYDYKILVSADLTASPWASETNHVGQVVLFTTTGTTLTHKTSASGIVGTGFTASGSSKGTLCFIVSNASGGTPSTNNSFTVNSTVSNKYSVASNPNYSSGSVTWSGFTGISYSNVNLFEIT